nr:Holliday junction resolvase RecU [Allofustis seminis]
MSPLTVKYPNGSTPFQQQNDVSNSPQNVTYGNRGMTLEEDINLTNRQYLALEKAVIHKKPTPIQVVAVDYPKRSAAKITEAYYRTASTTDYNGLYRGYYLDFEAKETKNATRFPLNNFHRHQIEHMQQCIKHGGIVFVLIRFRSLEETYVCPATFIIEWWQQMQSENGRKSIPYQEIVKNCYLIPMGYSPRLAYLDAVDDLILKQSEEV